MTNFTTPQGTSVPDGNKKPGQAGGYKSRLDEILAKAGSNNPIAAAQAKASQQPAQAQPAAAPQAQAAPAAQPQVPPAAMPAAAAPTQPQNPSDRLQQILAMAGQTPAQRAQTQAQQALANNAASIQAMLQAYMQAVAQDPRKVLKCDIEFSGNPGANADIYFRCYADQAGNVYWDVFGDDISYVVPPKTSGYQLYDDYYKGVPYADLMADMATASVHSHAVV